MLSPAAYLIVLDTLSKLHAHGYCRGCSRRFGVPGAVPDGCARLRQACRRHAAA
jgi:hypothetical protein